MERTLILDFDGTVAVGDEPALAYARSLAALHDSLADLEDRVGRHLAGEEVAGFEHAEDGYMAAYSAARAAPIDPAAVSAAFLGVRAGLGDGSIELRTPRGLADELAALRSAGARVMLVTNAPGAGLGGILDLLGVSHVFDAVVPDAGKPAGLDAVLDGLGHTVDRERVLSVGDIWGNDCALPADRGAATALIDPHLKGRGTPDVRVRGLPELYAPLRIWASTGHWPRGSDRLHNDAVTTL